MGYSLRTNLGYLLSEIEELKVEGNEEEIKTVLKTLGEIVDSLDAIEGWNNEVLDVLEASQGSRYLADLVTELEEPVKNIEKEVY